MNEYINEHRNKNSNRTHFLCKQNKPLLTINKKKENLKQLQIKEGSL